MLISFLNPNISFLVFNLTFNVFYPVPGAKGVNALCSHLLYNKVQRNITMFYLIFWKTIASASALMQKTAISLPTSWLPRFKCPSSKSNFIEGAGLLESSPGVQVKWTSPNSISSISHFMHIWKGCNNTVNMNLVQLKYKYFPWHAFIYILTFYQQRYQSTPFSSFKSKEERKVVNSYCSQLLNATISVLWSKMSLSLASFKLPEQEANWLTSK